jgi:hypothetical protein
MPSPRITSRLDIDANPVGFYDINTDETVARFQACFMEDDFVGAGHNAGVPAAGSPVAGYPWVKKIVGAAPPTVAALANTAGGVMAVALTATSEKQDAVLYSNDQLTWDMTKGAVFEARLALHVLPSAAQVEMVWGLQSAWIDGPDNASFYAQFQVLANGAVNVRTKDGVNTVSNASGVTLVADAYREFRIDATDPTEIQFFIDGTKVSPTGSATKMAFAATGANALLQPYLGCYKASGTGIGTMYIDVVQIGMNRS